MIIVEWFRLYYMLTLKTRLYDTIIYINKCLSILLGGFEMPKAYYSSL